MTPEEAMNYLSTVGFPIIACYFMWKFINGTLAEFSKMLCDNTVAITKLCDRLGGKESEGDEQDS